MAGNASILYKQVYEVLRAGIDNGTYPPGSRLPTEPELMEQFRVSRVTVRQALGMLKRDGLVVSMPAKGTFVAKANDQWRELTERLIVVVTPDVESGFFANIIRGIEREAYAGGFYVIVHASNDLVAEEERCLQGLSSGAAGFVIAAAAIGRSSESYRRVVRQGIPLVFVDRCPHEPGVDCVTSDNVRGGYLATRHLLDLGHTRIGVIVPRACATYPGRIEGYRRALAEAGIDADEALIARPDETLQDGANVEYLRQGDLLMHKLLTSSAPPTAIFVPNNMAAVGALRCLQSRGIRVPDQIAIVGYDGVDSTGYVTPALTTVDQQPLQMGTVAARLLLGRIRKEVLPPQNFTLPVTLCIRESSEPAQPVSMYRGDGADVRPHLSERRLRDHAT